MEFIILTTPKGNKFRLNVNHLVTYWSLGNSSEIQTTREVETVAETNEEIDILIRELRP